MAQCWPRLLPRADASHQAYATRGRCVSSSSGEVPTTFEQMGTNAVAFSRALGLNKMDVLGFSIGGMVAQEIALQAPNLVRKLIL
jgi:pimeloyl-ACP methyl ester carboxylesterase